MFSESYNPNIDYTEYKMRMCGNTWRYCDAKCNKCGCCRTIMSNHTTISPSLINTSTTYTTFPHQTTTINSTEFYQCKDYSYTIDYKHKDSYTGQSYYDYCKMYGPWSYYREIYGWKSELP